MLDTSKSITEYDWVNLFNETFYLILTNLFTLFELLLFQLCLRILKKWKKIKTNQGAYFSVVSMIFEKSLHKNLSTWQISSYFQFQIWLQSFLFKCRSLDSYCWLSYLDIPHMWCYLSCNASYTNCFIMVLFTNLNLMKLLAGFQSIILNSLFA